MPSPVTIVGATGDLGFGLALRLARAGVAVTIGSRDAGRAAEAAERVAAAVPGAQVSGLANSEAAAANDLVVLSVPFATQAATLRSLREALKPGTVLLDVTVPLAAAVGGRPTRVLSVWQGSAAQQAQELVPDGVTVVSGLHTVAARHLADLDHELDEDTLLAGDDRAAKARVAALVGLIGGLRPIDAGRLEMARITEQLTALAIGINIRHKATAGLKVTGLPNGSAWQ
ncbi:NADPH-dependent F420 reductase [Conexibacter sp. JD483]|uniref:NADPH-dependent F420 reductase n=1 Tax=unclassified Conexibacter TaxID=2627773 RepID=UPI0027227349|nr:MULTISPECIES: NADPH-dependent F420 reductase [unclassified Conexibacter]MDO8188019.1 NADPH-dependent F420 reductase [Conexibacter sp. CPCC 205706]MDO8200902.1 NADPH-dependent F420 reductase [Conexibacter sp. CPCC 205762]MDR9372730.1 NADPH-dependent F420 reductase [Conexibacter sp. JD483]